MKIYLIPVAIATAAILCCTYADTDPAKGMCILGKSQSVEYRCLVEGTTSRACKDSEPHGTVVQPKCTVGYYSSGEWPYMRCIDGRWDYIATCIAECGTIPPTGTILRRSVTARHGEVPWHAMVYRKTTTPYMALCGATLVSEKAVLSVAHCFWDALNNKPYPVENYAVAVGKVHRDWSAKEDEFAQKSEVTEIKIPPRFLGISANLQEDIAVVILATKIAFGIYVRPVCLNFDVVFERRQLQANTMGKTAAWRTTESLKMLEMTFIPIDECLASSPAGYREFITADKICVKSKNGTGLCVGDSGVGVSFPDQDLGATRYYLRGIASTAPRTEDKCNTDSSIVLLTQISKHEHFIKEFI